MDCPLVSVLARVHVPVKTSLASDEVTVTVPVGNCLVPALSVSATVTVTLLDCPVTTLAGFSPTVVLVERRVTVKLLPVLSALLWWTLSVAVKLAVMVCGLTAALEGVYVTSQLTVPAGLAPCASVQVPKVPAPVVPRLTVPAGFDTVPLSVSTTVTLTVVDCATTTDEGVRLVTVVEVKRLVTVTDLPVVSLLSWWTLSLAVKLAVMVSVLVVPVIVPPGVYVAVQLTVPAGFTACESVQVLKLPLVSVLERATVPAGLEAVPAPVSTTVTVTVAPTPRATEPGEMLVTVVDVGRLLTTWEPVPLLPLKLVSPA